MRAWRRRDRPCSKKIAAVLIAGPTASGKSALALALAAGLGGVVINADSMQVYRRACAILTARPVRGGGAGAAPALRPSRAPARPVRSGACAAERRRPRSGAWQRTGAADLRRRHRPLFHGAEARARADPAHPAGDPRSAGASALLASRRRALHARLTARIRTAAALPPERPQRVLARLEVARGHRRAVLGWHRQTACGRGDPERCAARCAPARSRRADASMTGSTAALRGMIAAAALDEVRRSWHAVSIRRCRPCRRSACEPLAAHLARRDIDRG